MALRPMDEQGEHDQVIKASAATYQGKDVRTNPNGEQNFAVKGVYPDIVVMDNSGNLIKLEEIETGSSVNVNESKQWKEYASFGIPMNLVVPKDLMKTAKELIAGINNILVQGYVFDSSGHITFAQRVKVIYFSCIQLFTRDIIRS